MILRYALTVMLLFGAATSAQAGLAYSCKVSCSDEIATCVASQVIRPKRALKFCRKLVLGACRAAGLDVCLPPPTTTTTSTSTTSSTSVIITTTTVHLVVTTTTTLPRPEDYLGVFGFVGRLTDDTCPASRVPLPPFYYSATLAIGQLTSERYLDGALYDDGAISDYAAIASNVAHGEVAQPVWQFATRWQLPGASAGCGAISSDYFGWCASIVATVQGPPPLLGESTPATLTWEIAYYGRLISPPSCTITWTGALE